jgi:hypothetical protein
MYIRDFYRSSNALEGADMQIRIVMFTFFNISKAERAIERLVNDGWKVLTSGGGGSIPAGFVVLQKGE